MDPLLPVDIFLSGLTFGQEVRELPLASDIVKPIQFEDHLFTRKPYCVGATFVHNGEIDLSFLRWMSLSHPHR